MTKQDRRMKNRTAKRWKEIIIERIKPGHVVKVACSVWWLYADRLDGDPWFYYVRNLYTPDNEIPIDELGALLARVGVPAGKIANITKCKFHDRIENGGAR